MKKVLCLILVFVMCLGLVACGKKSNHQNNETGVSSKITTPNTKETDTTGNTPATTKETSTAPNETTTGVSGEANNSAHTHSFSVATCMQPRSCSCGATEGSALGHEFQSLVCIRCDADQHSDFADLKKYYWKHGREIVNVGVPGKEGLAPYAVELVLLDFQRSSANVSAGDTWTEYTSSDSSYLYPTPNMDVKARVYNGRVYSVTTEAYPRFTYEVQDSLLVVTFADGGVITLKKNGSSELTVVSCTGTNLSSVSVGTTFKAYPRWEIFNGV